MNDTQENHDDKGYWQASDGQWYPPEQHPFNIERAALAAAKADKKEAKAAKKAAKVDKKEAKVDKKEVKADKKEAKADKKEAKKSAKASKGNDKEAEDHDNGVLAAKESMTLVIGSGRDIKKIKDHLYEGETVEGIARAILKNKVGALVMTDQRIMFVRSGRFSQDVVDIPRDRIGSVHYSGSMIQGASLEFHTSNTSLKVTGMVKKDAQLVKQRIGTEQGSTASNERHTEAPHESH